MQRLREALIVSLFGLGMFSGVAEAREPFSFLSQPTDQLAVPGRVESAQLTPEANLYYGQGEIGLRVGGVDYRQPNRVYPYRSIPLLRSSQQVGTVTYQVDHLAVDSESGPMVLIRVTAKNRGDQVRTARVSFGYSYSRGTSFVNPSGQNRFMYRYPRPEQPSRLGLQTQIGVGFSPEWRYRYENAVLSRDQLALATFPVNGRAWTSQASRVSDLGARVGYQKRLASGAQHAWTVVVALNPSADAPPRISFARAMARARRDWSEQTRGMVKIRIPEAKVQETYYRSVQQLLESRYQEQGQWVQTVNKLQYHAFWIRDAATITQALDLAGLHQAARQNLDFLLGWQHPDGLFISRSGQLDGMGQALWVLAEHARLTRDPEYARRLLPVFDRGMQWLAQSTAGEADGLLPFSDPKDNELVAGKLSGDQLFAQAGMHHAVLLARLADDPQRAAQWDQQYRAFADHLRGRILQAIDRYGYLPPSLDRPDGQQWGNLWLAYPVALFDPASAAVRRSTNYLLRNYFREGVATYFDRRSLHHYLGFKLLQGELAAGRAEVALRGFYDALAHTTSSHGGFEMGVPVKGTRRTRDNLSPHGMFSAEYIALLRNLLVREDSEGQVRILDGLSPAWVAPGKVVQIQQAPTASGPVSVALRGTRSGARLSWQAPQGVQMTWKLPEWMKTPPGQGRALSLTGQGQRSLTFTNQGQGLALSWEAARDRVCDLYRNGRHPISGCR